MDFASFKLYFPDFLLPSFSSFMFSSFTKSIGFVQDAPITITVGVAHKLWITQLRGHLITCITGGHTIIPSTLGIGENSTTSMTVRRHFGGVRNLSANVNNYTMTVQWDAPSDIQAKDIKVCDSVRNSITYGNHPHKRT